MRVVLISPSATPLPAVSLLHRLHEADYEPTLCIELTSRAAKRNWRATFGELLSPRVSPVGPLLHGPLATDLRIREIPGVTVADACEEAHAAHLRVRDLAGDSTALEISTHRPDVIIALSGVEPRSELATLANDGLLTVRFSAEPMRIERDELLWTLFSGARPCVSVVHTPSWDDSGQAATPLVIRDVAREKSTLAMFAGLLEFESVEAVLDALKLVAEQRSFAEAAGQRELEPVREMAPPLAEVVEHWLATGRTPRGASR